jgi:hypothetical protein
MTVTTLIQAPARPKSFDVPHKALRSLLAQLSQLAGSTDYREPDQVSALHALGQDLFELLTIHAHDENEVVLADLERRRPGAGHHNLEDHEEIEERQSRLEMLLDEVLALSRRGEDASEAGLRFYRDLNRFQSAYLLHMLEEEEATQALLWEVFSDAEMMEHRKRILARNPPATLLKWMQYSLPAQSGPDRALILRGMQAAMPAAFVAQVLETAKRVLKPEEWTELKGMLGL